MHGVVSSSQVVDLELISSPILCWVLGGVGGRVSTNGALLVPTVDQHEDGRRAILTRTSGCGYREGSGKPRIPQRLACLSGFCRMLRNSTGWKGRAVRCAKQCRPSARILKGGKENLQGTFCEKDAVWSLALCGCEVPPHCKAPWVLRVSFLCFAVCCFPWVRTGSDTLC